jgi:hypothetical protein
MDEELIADHNCSTTAERVVRGVLVSDADQTLAYRMTTPGTPRPWRYFRRSHSEQAS